MALRPLTDEERARAREKATAARTARAEIKKGLRDGSITVAQVLRRGEEDVSLLKVTELLEATPGIGKVRSAAIMKQIGIAPTRRVRGLGQHQRKALVDYLDR